MKRRLIIIVRCKMFVGTLAAMTLDWFSSLPEGHVFEIFSRVIVHFAANKIKPLKVGYFFFFYIKQAKKESLK